MLSNKATDQGQYQTEGRLQPCPPLASLMYAHSRGFCCLWCAQTLSLGVTAPAAVFVI